MKHLILFSSFVLLHSSFATPLNVLFIAVDDLRPELGCYHAAHMKTPHLDRLASQAMSFERAYCQVAVCNPSRSSVLSGTRPDTTGVLDNQHFMRPNMPDVISLPQHFKNHGYTSLSLGKIFHHSEREPGDDPQSWSEPSWYHGEPYKHWFTQESLDYVKQLKALPKAQQPKQLRAAPFEAADEPDASYPDAQTAAAPPVIRDLLSELPSMFGNEIPNFDHITTLIGGWLNHLELHPDARAQNLSKLDPDFATMIKALEQDLSPEAKRRYGIAKTEPQ